MAAMMSWIVTFLNEMNVTGCDGSVDVAHGLGEPRTSVSLSLVYGSCLFIFVSLFLFSSCYLYTYDSVLQMDCSNVNDNSRILLLS